MLKATPDIESYIEDIKSVSGLEAECRFTKKIFSTMLSFDFSPSMSHSEATFNTSLLHPCLLAVVYLLQKKKSDFRHVFVAGEEPLKAMVDVLTNGQNKNDLRKRYHADAVIRVTDLVNLEVLLLETSGCYKNTSDRKITFYSTKGMFALLALMKKEGSLVENPGRQCLTPFPLRLLHDSKGWSSFPPSKR